MADEAENEDVEGEGEDAADGEGEDGGKKKGSKKKLIMIVAAALLVLGGGGGGAYMFGLFGGGEAGVEEEEEVAAVPPPVFFDLPDITVNLAAIDERSQYLRLKVALELAEKGEIAEVEPQLARVLDAFQVYLRELRVTDLEGSAGVYRLKEELLRRINLAVYPAQVEDILFKELLIQ
jgi:flagellar FliL protein